MIRTISIEGFKSIASQTLELGRLNCFIGANGVGKSNFLEAIGILGAAANGRVDDEAIQRRGVRAGVPRLYKTSFEEGVVPSHITLSAKSDAGSEYKVSLEPRDKLEDGWTYRSESLADGLRSVVRSVQRRVGRIVFVRTSGLAALKLAEFAEQSAPARILTTLQSYAIYQPNTPVLRGIAPDTQMRLPVGLSGGGLAEAFGKLKMVLGNDGGVFELLDWVQDIGSQYSAGSLLASSVPRTKRVLVITDRRMKEGRNKLTAYDASEGALYVLFAAILCLSKRTPKLFAIDNLDQALNPRMVTRVTEHLAGWLKAADPERQLLFTAHNPAVLDGLDLTDSEVRLFAVDRNSVGHTCVRRIELNEKLRKLHEEYPLSRLWMMGHLGAVPNV